MDDDYLIVRNPSPTFRADIVRRIKANDGYCLSKADRIPENKCHCREFKQTGICTCGLFIKVPCIEIKEE